MSYYRNCSYCGRKYDPRSSSADKYYCSKRCFCEDTGTDPREARKTRCFVTTAVCEAAGLPDDCRELRTLRQFRDTWMMTTPERRAKVAEYYAEAPAAVRQIDQRIDRIEVYAELRQAFILPSVELIEYGEFDAAEDRYTAMMTHVRSLV